MFNIFYLDLEQDPRSNCHSSPSSPRPSPRDLFIDLRTALLLQTKFQFNPKMLLKGHIIELKIKPLEVEHTSISRLFSFTCRILICNCSYTILDLVKGRLWEEWTKLNWKKSRPTLLSVFSLLLSTTDFSSHSLLLRFRAAPDLLGISEV